MASFLTFPLSWQPNYSDLTRRTSSHVLAGYSDLTRHTSSHVLAGYSDLTRHTSSHVLAGYSDLTRGRPLKKERLICSKIVRNPKHLAVFSPKPQEPDHLWPESGRTSLKRTEPPKILQNLSKSFKIFGNLSKSTKIQRKLKKRPGTEASSPNGKEGTRKLH